MSVLSLSQAKAHLNITTSDNDGELQAVIDSAEAAIARRVGPLAPTTVTARVAGGSVLSLPVSPISSLTSVVTSDGTSLTVGDLYASPESGVVSFNSGGSFGSRYYTVTYVAGRTTCPADLLMAVRELVRHLWETQRGAVRRPGSMLGDAPSNTLPGAAYVFPFRVEQLLAPHTQPGFA